MVRNINKHDLKVMRSIVQAVGWKEFMQSVASLMAEQSDKVPLDSEQEINLVNCSNSLFALDKFFTKCGEFDYIEAGESLGIPDMVYGSIISGNYNVH